MISDVGHGLRASAFFPWLKHKENKVIVEETSGWGLSPLITAGVIILLALIILWCLIPFALFGIRRRLGRIARILEEIRDEGRARDFEPIFGRAGAPPGGGGEPPAVERLFAELRRLMGGLSPRLREKVVDSRNSEFTLSLGDRPSPFASASLKEGWIEISFHLKTLAQTFPTFGEEEFERYMRMLLHEKYGFFIHRPPDGSGLILHLEPHPRSNLELLLSIIREKVLDRVHS